MKPDIALIGHGYWGKNIARNLYQMGRLHSICETQTAEHPRIASLYSGIRLCSDPATLWGDNEVTAVAISTPAANHAALSLEALNAGKDVFVEKPLALNYADGEKMVRLASHLNRILMVGHLLEYHPAVERLQSLIAAGELGALQYLYSNRLNLGKFRSEENILWSFAPHDIAVILRLVGAYPQEVMATGAAYLQPNVADTTVTHLSFPGGVLAHIFVSWLHPYKEQKLVVVGARKMAVFDDRAEDGHKLMLFDKGADWVDNRPIPRKGEGQSVPLEPVEPLRAELDHFTVCVDTRTQPLTDGWNGLRVLHILEAAQASLSEGGSRISPDHAGVLSFSS